uniref:F-box/FBD/LRR-repeat protein At1g13570-like n=1 Tax=Nicotiana tabacum TaxID=4097 RepID=A0A1S4ABT1_TOBAC|nr:PREDICTED: F-box/FBD/LRR-repeat protein At1g13570-like [Nicotiana tabacum]
MPPKRRKIKQSDTSQESIVDEDIITNLPRSVIDCILGKMPIREAVRTSVFSKKWRFYYLTIPELVFDDQFCKELQDYAATQKKLRMLSEYELELKYQFDEIVTKSLMLHRGRIETFKACIPSFNSTRVPNVNKWILYLSRKNIKKLTLEYKKDIRLELHLCAGIRHVNISGSKLKRLHIKAYDKYESISLENAPNLTEVSVMLDRVVTGSEKL